MNPYKQPVVTLKQWVKEKRKRDLDKKITIATDRVQMAHMKLEKIIQETKEQRKQVFYDLIEKGESVIKTP